jgi:hypothetical protein
MLACLSVAIILKEIRSDGLYYVGLGLSRFAIGCGVRVFPD